MPSRLHHARAAIEKMHGYTPGEQPAPGERVVKLNTNENPFPPSPKVMQAIRKVEPDAAPLPEPHRRRLPRRRGPSCSASPTMILAGNGSDDILTIATRTFVPPGGTLAYPDPTYSLYPVLAAARETPGSVGVPWERDWSLPIDALLDDQGRRDLPRQPQRPQRARSSRRRRSRSWRTVRRACCWSTRRTSTSPTTTAWRSCASTRTSSSRRTLSKALQPGRPAVRLRGRAAGRDRAR